MAPAGGGGDGGREENHPNTVRNMRSHIPHSAPALSGALAMGQALYYVSSRSNPFTPQKTPT